MAATLLCGYYHSLQLFTLLQTSVYVNHLIISEKGQGDVFKCHVLSVQLYSVE